VRSKFWLRRLRARNPEHDTNILVIILFEHFPTVIPIEPGGFAKMLAAAPPTKLLLAPPLMPALARPIRVFRYRSRVASRPEYADGFEQFGNNFAVPALFLSSFPDGFVGIGFAAIGIGALVPAAIMSIAAQTFIRATFTANSSIAIRRKKKKHKWPSGCR